MITVGLTGGIASGKSTVSAMFREHGIPVICADELAHEAVKLGSPALLKIRQIFGNDVFDLNGDLDRTALGSKVFGNHELKTQLEHIIHPVVARKKDELLEHYAGLGHSIVVVDVPLLYETGWDKTVDVVVVVYVKRDLQEQRLVARNGLTPDEAAARLNSQLSIEEKKNRAHILIDNSGSIDETRSRLAQVVEELKSRSRASK